MTDDEIREDLEKSTWEGIEFKGEYVRAPQGASYAPVHYSVWRKDALVRYLQGDYGAIIADDHKNGLPEWPE